MRDASRSFIRGAAIVSAAVGAAAASARRQQATRDDARDCVQAEITALLQHANPHHCKYAARQSFRCTVAELDDKDQGNDGTAALAATWSVRKKDVQLGGWSGGAVHKVYAGMLNSYYVVPPHEREKETSPDTFESHARRVLLSR
eukprot:3777055-Pleurochrysis_carterae.AAC.5